MKFLDSGGSPQLYYHDCSGSGRIPGHATRASSVGFELETNGFQLYAIADLPTENAKKKNNSFFFDKCLTLTLSQRSNTPPLFIFNLILFLPGNRL